MGGNIPCKLILDILDLLKSFNTDPEIRKNDHKNKVKMVAATFHILSEPASHDIIPYALKTARY
jgi:hypothetical protein